MSTIGDYIIALVLAGKRESRTCEMVGPVDLERLVWFEDALDYCSNEPVDLFSENFKTNSKNVENIFLKDDKVWILGWVVSQ
jgi:hypothetical protein